MEQILIYGVGSVVGIGIIMTLFHKFINRNRKEDKVVLTVKANQLPTVEQRLEQHDYQHPLGCNL